jgi:hypothetical protein
VAAIEGRVAFCNEVVDITVDGERLDRPVTLFNEQRATSNEQRATSNEQLATRNSQLAPRPSADGGVVPPPSAGDRA